MKAILLIACCLILSTDVFAADSPSAKPMVPAWPKHEGTRPLLRFLIATLHMPDAQALEVQQLLKTRSLGTPTPSELANLLFPVLTEAQFAKYQDLADNDMLGPNLHYLASLH